MRVFENKSWKEVVRELADEFPEFDESDLRQGVERHTPYILAAFLERHAALLKSDPNENLQPLAKLAVAPHQSLHILRQQSKFISGNHG